MRIQVNRNRNGEPLTNEQIQKFAPSAFAGQCHDSRSDRYTFVPTVEVIDGMRDAGFSPVAALQSRSSVPGKALFTKHMIRFRSMGETLAQVGDTAVEVALVNSHDGTSQYELSLGAFRLACLNGMMVSDGVCETIKVRHIGNIIHRIVESTTTLIQFAPKVVEAIKTWKQILLSTDEQSILAEGALALRFDGEAPITPSDLLVANRSADTASDLWSVFNRLQENTVRGSVRYITPSSTTPAGDYIAPRRNRTREVKGIDNSNKLNRELWSLAQKMADLKS